MTAITSAICLFIFISLTHAKRSKSSKGSSYTDLVSDEALCACWDIKLTDINVISAKKVCYSYEIGRGLSSAEYCKKSLSSFIINAGECMDPPSNADLLEAIRDVDPCMYEADVTLDGGIEIIFESDDDDGKKNRKRARRLLGWGKPSKSKEPKTTSTPTEDSLHVFSICFDPEMVDGTRSGTIDITAGCNNGYTATCHVGEISPDFCPSTPCPTDPENDIVVPLPTPDPTTAAPTTAAPTTADPTTAAPTLCVSACPMLYTPVCGSDGKTYSNGCFAVCHGATVRYEGPCTPAPTTPSPVTPAPVTPAPVTPAPTTPSPVTSEPTTAAPTQCRDKCPLIYEAVCGADGNTYSNFCFAGCYGVDIDYVGSCTPAPTTSSPTTSAPTTPAPTTSAPTTTDPTTADPTTSSPTTAEPTTSSPTSADPTTAAPTTAAPTTASPTTASPTTAEPTTAEPTTLQPTSAPTYTICDTEDALNVGFLLDESASVSFDQWQIIKNFVDRIIYFDISPVSSVKMWKYATYSFFQEIADWTMNDGNGGQDALRDAIQNTGYSQFGLTMTWDAVNRVLDDYWEYRFQCTDGCETRSDLLFLITDGAPTGEAVCPNMTDRMNQSSVDIVIILIDPNNNIDASKIDCLDTKDDKQDVYRLPDFDSAAFTTIEERIRQKTCNGNTPAGPGERPAEGSEWVYPDGSVGLGPVPESERTGGAGGAGDAQAGGNAQAVFGSPDVFSLPMQHRQYPQYPKHRDYDKKTNNDGFDDFQASALKAIFNGLVFLAMLAVAYLVYHCSQQMKREEPYKMVECDIDSETDEESDDQDF